MAMSTEREVGREETVEIITNGFLLISGEQVVYYPTFAKLVEQLKINIGRNP